MVVSWFLTAFSLNNRDQIFELELKKLHINYRPFICFYIVVVELDVFIFFYRQQVDGHLLQQNTLNIALSNITF